MTEKSDKNPGKSTDELRRNAEEQALDRVHMRLPQSPEETQRLLHELQVHQIELEMQNEELRRSREELETVLERYTGLYDFAPVGYATLDCSGMICSANFTLAKLLGIERSFLVGRNFIRFVTSEARMLFTEFIETAFDGKSKGRDCYEVQLLTVENIPLFVQIEVDAFGNGQECRIAVMDITLRRQAEEAHSRVQELNRKIVQEAHEQLEQRVAERTNELADMVEYLQKEIVKREKAELELKEEVITRLKNAVDLREKDKMLIQQNRLAAMGEMINNIAHQWRQPLNVLGLSIQQLSLFYDSPLFTKEFLQGNTAKSMELIKHMSRTIDDFRDFFNTDKEMKLFDVAHVIDKAVELTEQSFQFPKIPITIHADGNVMVNGYRNEFAQVLINILKNARDVLVERSVETPFISVHTFVEGAASVVTITDNAGGIDEEIIDKLFDPYFTTKGPDKGTGIGLYMSKTIIETNLAGRLTVRNTGNGAEFRIEVTNADS
jgi:PAS domain S-box-containing protein